MSKKVSLFWRIITVLAAAVVLLNIAACFEDFCNIYTDHVYGVIADVGAGITNGIPISIGEILMYAGIILLLITFVLVILLIFFRKRQRYKTFVTKYMKSMLCIFMVMLLVYTFNWIIPFRSSIMGKADYNDFERNKNTMSSEAECKALEEHLRIIRTELVDNLNTLTEQVERDDEGRIIYAEKDEVERKVAVAMQGLSDEFPRLEGFYPQLKFALCSELLNYMWIGGYTYPYTMEVAGNRYTDKLYYPALYAHESAHHQGYYQENEANLLEYLGCINSDDKVIQYSGYLSMYYYIDDAYIAVLSEMGDDTLWEEYDKIKVADQVWADSDESIAQSDEEFENEDRPMQQFESTAEDVADVGWETQGELLDENSYDGVVDLMLIYYDGKLY